MAGIKQKTSGAKIGKLDIEMAVAVGICIVLGWIIPRYQVMTTCITTLMCTQTEIKLSWKSLLIRLTVTAIGGIVGIGVVLLDDWLQNQWLVALFMAVGVLLTLFGCKLAKVPDFNGRIGCVILVLVSITLPGPQRLLHALFRLMSTLIGAAVALTVVGVFSILRRTPRIETVQAPPMPSDESPMKTEVHMEDTIPPEQDEPE